jgi:hypothetical protein
LSYFPAIGSEIEHLDFQSLGLCSVSLFMHEPLTHELLTGFWSKMEQFDMVVKTKKPANQRFAGF